MHKIAIIFRVYIRALWSLHVINTYNTHLNWLLDSYDTHLNWFTTNVTVKLPWFSCYKQENYGLNKFLTLKVQLHFFSPCSNNRPHQIYNFPLLKTHVCIHTPKCHFPNKHHQLSKSLQLGPETQTCWHHKCHN